MNCLSILICDIVLWYSGLLEYNTQTNTLYISNERIMCVLCLKSLNVVSLDETFRCQV